MSSPSDFTEKMDGGIKNKCRFIINDVGDRLESHGGELKCLMRTHIVNICTGESRKTKSWVGYGTCKRGRGNKNQTDQGTTLLGFQVTNDKSFGFAKRDASYNNIRTRFNQKFGDEDSFGNNSYRIPAISLFGLQTTNNRSMQDYKYLHIGAYTSAGCPSLVESEENYNVIEQLAKDGPSVVVNYKEGKMEDFEKCEERDE
ncbi:MAG: hypothetical protein NXH75_03400 [Halobacteriovoraceae bacterium]|nr:hypothetical protein [Halobacteriovoraceae bacterium]